MKKVIAALLVIGLSVGGTTTSAKSISAIESAKVCTSISMVNGKVWRDVYYMYQDNTSSYWLDLMAEPGNNVLRVDHRSITRWKIDKRSLKSGEQRTGVFDKSGRILLKVK